MVDIKKMAESLTELGYKNTVNLYYARPHLPHLIEAVKKLYWDVQARGEFDWFYSCKDKNPYGTAWEATKAAYRQSEWRGRDFEPYHCRHCGKYHVGRVNDQREEKRKYYDEQIRKNTLPQR